MVNKADDHAVYFHIMTMLPLNARAWLFYVQAAVLTFAALYFASALLVPMCYGLLLAVILYPMCKFLEKRGWPRWLSISIGLITVLAVCSGLVALLIVQLNIFRHDLPELAKRLHGAIVSVQQWIYLQFGISVETQSSWWQRALYNIASNPAAAIKSTIYATAGTFLTLFLVPVYTALFLYNRGTFVQFIVKLTPENHRQALPGMLEKVIGTYARFIRGMVFVYLIVGALNSIGFFALGIKHAVLFGMITAIMTIIPYVGIIISSLLPITIAWITKDSVWYPVGVVAILTFVQYLEANIIFPKVVATQLNVSTWATLVAIITGGLIWGVSGMILSIPFVGILKIICEQFPSGDAVNILLGRGNENS